MAQTEPMSSTRPESPDRLTLIAISALAYLAATGLHEHLGHTLSCILLGSHPTDVGAFYVNCDYTGMSNISIRLVALAGPLVSLLTGIVSFFLLHRLPPRAIAAGYFVWLLGSIGLMSATGYLLFSGFSGIGDFGLERDGLLYQAAPAWLWRLGLTIVGIASYILVISFAVREIAPRIGGAGVARVRYARHLTLISYLTGAVVSIAIGLLNPYGLIIVAISAAASSLGATSGLLWMMQLLKRDQQAAVPWLTLGRSWGWIVVGGIATIAYALILGPTLRP
jgi:hypothetical protein